jgi:hypothetical protein
VGQAANSVLQAFKEYAVESGDTQGPLDFMLICDVIIDTSRRGGQVVVPSAAYLPVVRAIAAELGVHVAVAVGPVKEVVRGPGR